MSQENNNNGGSGSMNNHNMLYLSGDEEDVCECQFCHNNVKLTDLDLHE